MKTSSLALLLSCFCVSSAVLAADDPMVTDDPLVAFEANLRVDNDFNPTEAGAFKYNLRFQRFEAQASIRLFKNLPDKIADEVLLVVRSKMEQDVMVNGILDANHLSVGDYLKEAYVELKRVGGLPIAVIVGTSEVSYGQDFPGTVDFQNDAAHAMTDPDQGQVKGFTIILDQELIKIFDSFELTLFNSNPDFFKGGTGHLDAFAFRVTKTLSEHLQGEISFMRKGDTYASGMNPETKLSVGGAYRNGLWTVWGEGVAMKNSESYPGAALGGTFGVHRITGPGQIDLEATAIQKTLKQFAAGYELFLTRHWTIGPTFRYTYCVGGDEGCYAARGYGQGPSVGISARLTFGGDEDNENPTWIGKKAAPKIKRLFMGRQRSKSE